MIKYQNLFVAAIMAGVIFSGCTKERKIGEEGNLVPKTVEQDNSIPSISVNGTKLHSEVFGDANDPIIVVIHGGPGADYRSLLNCKQFAAQGYKVVFYDQRGSGLSKRHSKDSYTLQTHEDDLKAVITFYKKLASQKVFLLGHSWGAILATAYINRFNSDINSKINGVVLAEPGGLIWNDIKDYVTRARDYKFGGELMNDAFYFDQFISGKNVNDHAILDYKLALQAVTDGAKDNPIGNEGPVPFWRHGAVVNKALNDLAEKEKPNYTTNLSSFTTKVLFAYSGNNKAYGMDHAQKVSQPFPNRQIFKVNDAGHDMFSFPRGWKNFYPVALAYFNSLR